MNSPDTGILAAGKSNWECQQTPATKEPAKEPHFLSFLLPYIDRSGGPIYHWVMLKQLASLGSERLSVVADDRYFAMPIAWEQPVQNYGFSYRNPTQSEWRRFLKYSIPSRAFDPLDARNPSVLQAFRELLTEDYPPLREELGRIVDEFCSRSRPSALLSWCNCPSLMLAARERGLAVIHNELGPLRAPYYQGTIYFDFSGVNGHTSAAEEMKQFVHEAQAWPSFHPLNLHEIQRLLMTKDGLSVPRGPISYPVGAALQVEDDSNLIAFSRGLTNLDVVLAARKGLSPEQVLIRRHPHGHAGYSPRLGVVDESLNSIQFLSRCERVFCINSSVAFEALLQGKPVHLLGDSPAASLSWERLETMSSEECALSLNYLFLVYLVPAALLFDADYYCWRLSRPSLREIFDRHLAVFRENQQRDWSTAANFLAPQVSPSTEGTAAGSLTSSNFAFATQSTDEPTSLSAASASSLGTAQPPQSSGSVVPPALMGFLDRSAASAAEGHKVLAEILLEEALENFPGNKEAVELQQELRATKTIKKQNASATPKVVRQANEEDRRPTQMHSKSHADIQMNTQQLDNIRLEASIPEPYMSCAWQEGGITFGRGSLHVCCISAPGGGWDLIAPFAGGPLPVNDILRVRRESVRLNNAGGNPRCRGCGWLKPYTRKAGRYLVDWINLSHFTACNVDCGYCYIQRPGFQRVKKPYDVLGTLEWMLANNHLDPAVTTLWGGGEPVILKNFDRIFGILARHGGRQVVNTNATVFSAALRDGLATNPNVELMTALDAGTPETYLKIKGKDYFNQVIKNLALYVAAGGRKCTAKMIFVPENSSETEVRSFVDVCLSVGLKKVLLDVDVFSDNPYAHVPNMALLWRLAQDAGLEIEMTSCGSDRYPDFPRRVTEAAQAVRVEALRARSIIERAPTALLDQSDSSEAVIRQRTSSQAHTTPFHLGLDDSISQPAHTSHSLPGALTKLFDRAVASAADGHRVLAELLLEEALEEFPHSNVAMEMQQELRTTGTIKKRTAQETPALPVCVGSKQQDGQERTVQETGGDSRNNASAVDDKLQSGQNSPRPPRRPYKEFFGSLDWRADRMLMSGLEFFLQHAVDATGGKRGQGFLFYKTPELVQQYEEYFEKLESFSPEHVFEIGLWDGGSAVFWHECFHPQKHVAIDIQARTDCIGLDRYRAESGTTASLVTHWQTDQSDTIRLREIVEGELGNRLDLVIDDASHLYRQTRASFEALFPFVRPGGMYIIEDWAWGHWPSFQAADHPWKDEIPLTRLITELVEIVGGSNALVRSVDVRQGFVAVTRGAAPIERSANLRLEALISRKAVWF